MQLPSTAEAFVLQETAIGRVADLANAFPNQLQRQLPAAFIENLLTGQFRGARITRNGIRIHGAVIIGDIYLKHAEIPYDTALESCDFKGRIILEGSHFRTDFSLAGSTFETVAQGEDLSRLRVDGQLLMQGAIFKSELSLSSARLSESLLAGGAKFERSVSAQGMQISESLLLPQTEFAGPADFEFTQVGKILLANGAHFDGTNANFDSLRVGQNLAIKDAQFRGSVDFNFALIGGPWVADGAKFDGPQNQFYALQVGGYAEFNNARFLGSTIFRRATFEGRFFANRASFSEVTFEVSKLEDGAQLQAAVFSGPADFNHSHVAGQLTLQNAHFNGGAPVRFDGIVVSDMLSLEGAVFTGPVEFQHSEIDGQLAVAHTAFQGQHATFDYSSARIADFESASFLGAASFQEFNAKNQFSASGAHFQGLATFAGMEVNGPVIFDNATFAQGLSMEDARLGELSVKNKNPNDSAKSENISLNDSVISRDMTLENLHLSSLAAESLQVSGFSYFHNLTVDKDFDLVLAHFQDLAFDSIRAEVSQLYLTGITYNELSPESQDLIVRWANLSPFNPEDYARLESYLAAHGKVQEADEIFIQMQRRKSISHVHLWNPLTWIAYALQWLFLDMLTGYGRHPIRALWAGIVLIAIGVFLFWKSENMEVTEIQHTPPKFNPFWYTIDLFLPVADLNDAAQWRPKTPKRYIYSKLLPILGWIIVAIWLLGLAGLIK